MARILVTGGAGFVGANLVRRLLENGDIIHLFLSKETNPRRIQKIKEKVIIHDCNLIEREKMNDLIQQIKPEIIYHLATHGAYASQISEERIIATNLLGFMNLLNACKTVGFEKFINTGSSSEYGFKGTAMKESDMLEAPYSCYAFTKASATLYAQYLAKKENLPLVTLRLFSVYGDYEEPRRFIPSLIANTLQGHPTPLVSPETARDFIYVEDVINAYLLVSKKSKSLEPGEIFNIGSGEQKTIKEVVETVMQVTQSKIPVVWNSFPSRPWDTNNWQADITKIKEKVGWHPQHSLTEGIKKTISWIKKNREYYEKNNVCNL